MLSLVNANTVQIDLLISSRPPPSPTPSPCLSYSAFFSQLMIIFPSQIFPCQFLFFEMDISLIISPSLFLVLHQSIIKTRVVFVIGRNWNSKKLHLPDLKPSDGPMQSLSSFRLPIPRLSLPLRRTHTAGYMRKIFNTLIASRLQPWKHSINHFKAQE